MCQQDTKEANSCTNRYPNRKK